MTAIRRVVLVGFGNIGQGLLPLLDRHFQAETIIFDVTVKDALDPDFSKHEIWPWLVIDYISENEMPQDHINYGLFHPHPILAEAKYHNPWPPRIAQNSPLFEY